ncbi:alpha/beta fold hydrolase [Pseudoduganella sp. OTU4001]|uniref:alpha/beta fold hydrolase n=1 Tax=Pseudoduganella sp. OTU4001 TaxID=3043854 RepID=UPI00313C6031
MLNIDGVDVLVEGSGQETLLMIHGWPDTHHLWDGLVAELRERYLCVRFTLPGYDLAQPARAMSMDGLLDFFHAVAQRVSPERPVTLVLHDWGCVFGYEFAARYPGRVARIVGADIGDYNSGALRRALPLRAKLGIFYYQIGLALAWFVRGGAGNAIARHMARVCRCPGQQALVRWQQCYPYAMLWFGSNGGLRGLARVAPRCPMLYLYGEHKPFMFHSPEWLARIAAAPGCQVIGLPAGHWLMLRRPDEFNRAVADWLARTA